MRCSWCVLMPFFDGGKQVHRLKPDMQPDLAALHDGADRYRELLTAGVALETAGAMLITIQPGHTFAERAAVWAYWTVRPNPCLEPLAS